MKPRIYLDHNATSPLRPEVCEIIRRHTSDPLFNPSSIHGAGRKTRRLVDEAREEVARFLGANPSEIIFTSGGTESVHLAWNSFSRPDKKIITTSVEHACVLAAAEKAKRIGAQVTTLTVNRKGELESLQSEADFVSIQHANNETGVCFPIAEIFRKARLQKAITHTDAVQSAGKSDLHVQNLAADLLSISGHKLGALSGIGALYVRRGISFEPLWEGGAQEKGRRTGSENVLGILTLAEACKSIRSEGEAERMRIGLLRDRFEKEILGLIDGVVVTAASVQRLCNTSHLIFEDVDAESLLIACDLDGIDCSTGAACSSGSLKPSHVLLAMGFSPEEAHGSLRFSFGWNTSEEDVLRAIDMLPKLVEQVRKRGQNNALKLRR